MRFILPLMALLSCLLLSTPAAGLGGGSLSGSAEWRYGQYRANEEGKADFDASHFAQQYSLLYKKQGDFRQGRAGRFALALGAEWNSIDSEVNGEDIDIDTAKILYRGDLLLAPGGLPFRLHLFSRDMNQSQFREDTNVINGILAPGIVNSISNGQRLQSGATLLVGIRNGSYLGRYRDMLSQLPRLLMDYKEERVRDLKGKTPQHYISRNLAFVSLNKKDNWFHYRYYEFDDKLDDQQDFVEKSYALGTIDHTLQRRWINLTSWIRVSADGTFTTGRRVNVAEPAVRSFDLNLFATAKRSNWNSATFTTFSRTRALGVLSKDLEVPFYASGEFDRNTAWRFRFVGSRDRDERFDASKPSNDDSLFASARVETFRQRRFILAPEIGLEHRSYNGLDGYGVEFGGEFYSNRSFRPRHDLFGSVFLSYISAERRAGGSSDYWESRVKGRWESDLSSRLRTGLEQDVLFGSGTIDSTSVSHIRVEGDQGLTGSIDEKSNKVREGDVFRSTTTWFAELLPSTRFNNRFEIVFDYLSTEDETQDRFILSHDLRYDHRALSVTMDNRLTLGDNQLTSAFTFASDTLGSAGAAGGDISFANNVNVKYMPSRVWEGGVKSRFFWTDGDSGSTSQWDVKQVFQYNLIKVNGVVRKIAQLVEEVEYERFRRIDGDVDTATTFSLAGDYFPTRIAHLGAKVEYQMGSLQGYDELIYTLEAGLDFAKLQINFDYAYGTRSAGDITAGRDEHRWEVKVRKLF